MSLARLLYRRSILTYILFPASFLYSVVMRMRRAYYNKHPDKAYLPKTIVISVGNLVVGGSGKTPFTIYLANLIKKLGYSVAVSHRGYKGKYEKNVTIISDDKGMLPSAQGAGDEPVLIAEKLKGIPVIAGKNRKNAIKILERSFPDLDFIILDDSFQHLKVGHHHDFVLFKRSGILNNLHVFPAGPLREPLSALRYCDTLLTVSDTSPLPDGESRKPDNEIQAKIQSEYIAGMTPNNKGESKKILSGYYSLHGIYDENDREISAETLSKVKIALLSAIGQPTSFENTIKSYGLSFVHHYIFPDHYHFRNKNSFRRTEFGSISLKNVLDDRGKRFDVLLITEKDRIKLRRYSGLFTLLIAKISFTPDNEEQFTGIISELYNNRQVKPK